MQQLKRKSANVLEKIALRATRWIGSTNSLLIHTVLFVTAFVLFFWGVPIDKILLVVTTLVSLEAIYLSIFIQMSMNRQARRLHKVARDIDEIQEDVDEIQKDVEEIQEDVEGIEKDVEEIQEDVEGIEKDVEEIQEDVEEITEEEDDKDTLTGDEAMLSRIENTLGKLMEEISELKKIKKD